MRGRKTSRGSWRDPTDWGSHTFQIVLATLAGSGFLVGGLAALISGRVSFPRRRYSRDPVVLAGQDAILVGSVLAIGGAVLLVATYLYWRSHVKDESGRPRRPKADAVVASAMAFGIVLTVIAVLGARGAARSGSLAGPGLLLALGLALIGAGFLYGIAVGFAPRLLRTKKVYADALVDSRFGLDEDGMPRDDHPSPAEDGLVPYVRLRLPQGSFAELRCSSSVYDLAEPGKRGVAHLKGDHLDRFIPSR